MRRKKRKRKLKRLDAEGRAVRRAVDRALAEGVVTEDLAAPGEKARSTSEVGDYVASQI